MDDDKIYNGAPPQDLSDNPKICALDLPHVWAQLGRLHSRTAYLMRAAEAADAINDPAFANWAKGKAEELVAPLSVPTLIDEGSVQDYPFDSATAMGFAAKRPPVAGQG